LEAVAKVADAGAGVVGPADGDFLDVIAALEGDEENFRIESPAFDGLELEDGLGGGAGEGFESALSVGEGQAHNEAREGVETSAEDLAVEGLAMGLAAGGEPAGADGDIGAVGNGLEEAFGFFDRGREVGVGEHDDIAEGVEDARTWDLLRLLGCDLAQGYFISRPMLADQVLPWLMLWEKAPRTDTELAA